MPNWDCAGAPCPHNPNLAMLKSSWDPLRRHLPGIPRQFIKVNLSGFRNRWCINCSTEPGAKNLIVDQVLCANLEVGRVAKSLGQLEGDGGLPALISLEFPEFQPFQSSALDFGGFHHVTVILGEVFEFEGYSVRIELGSDRSRGGGCAGSARCRCRSARDAQLLPHE